MKKILTVIAMSLLLSNLGNQSFAQSNDKLVILNTNLGKIVIEFFPADAPNHVANFIKLSESGFYDGTIFHRIIPRFMIQGGDPNTKDGDESTWGTGGPSNSTNAEFNTIKHNRGIVSMARSADPNSAGSQFFIVHNDSNFLDGQYTVFGRLVTQESFETLDKIASVETGDKDIPINIEQVKITKAEVVNRSEVPNLLELPEPERTTSIISSSDNELYQNKALDIEFKVPEGWLLQQPEKTDKDTPDVVAVGPKVGPINPVISLTISNTNGKSLDDLIKEKTEFLKNATASGNLEIISQEKSTINEKQTYVTNARGNFESNGELYNVKFREIIISTNDKFYIFAYSNGVDNFDDQISKFEESVNSFKIISEPIKEVTISGLSLDGKIKVEITASNPTIDKVMSIDIKFRDSKNDELKKHANYSIIATQNNKEILSVIETYEQKGEGIHKTTQLSSDDPVDIKVTLLGFGLPEDKANWTGPTGEVLMFNAVPEFGPLVIMILVVAIISIIAISAKSRLNIMPRF